MANDEVSALELQPDPVRMVEGLRDTGYQFVTAIADIVDNSIAAEATQVDINATMDMNGSVTLTIADNGHGMTKDGLINAMKYGSRPRENKASLGKFGLGLKTASTAFCRKLVVVTRSGDECYRASWDLDHIQKSMKWELILDKPTQKQIAILNKTAGESGGTLVIWEKVDRLLKNYNNPGGAPAQSALKKYREELREHLELVYQRYLDDTDNRARNVTINLNGEPLSAWDPYCKSESELVNEQETPVEITPDLISSFTVRAFILPRKEEFSSEEAFKKARIRTNNQGVYIYRENRLIHGPDWMKMFSREPHANLLRVEFSFDHHLDEAFQIDIKKSQIILDESLYENVYEFLTPVRRAAEDAYRKGSKAKTSGAAKDAHDVSNRNISSKSSEIKQPDITIVDEAKEQVEVHNDSGTITVKLKLTTAKKPSEVHVQPTESIDNGLLWEPCLISSNIGLQLNTSHPYYERVYLPNLQEGVTIQGMDALLWALAVAELNCVDQKSKELFEELRYEVSKNLRKLVSDLPEPGSDE